MSSDTRYKIQVTRNKKIVGLCMLLVALLVGGLIRLWKLGAIPVSLYWDEAAMSYDAYSLRVWGKDMHGNPGFQAIFPSYGDYKLPVYIWFTSAVSYVTGPTPFAVRFPSAVAGIGLIALIYALSYELFHQHTQAGIASLVYACMPVDILFSRTGFEGHLALFFVGLTLYLWLLSRKKPLLLWLSSITAAAAVYTYFSARIAIPLFALVMLISLWKTTTWKWKIFFFGSMLLWALFLFPIYRSPYYSASNQFRLSTLNLTDTTPFIMESNILREHSGNSVVSRVVYHHYLLQAKEIITHISTHFDPHFLFLSGDLNLRHSTTTTGLLLLGCLPFFIVGWIHLFKTYFAIGFLLMGIWISSVLPAAIPMEVPHSLRSLNASLVFPLVIAFGMYYVLYKTKWRTVGMGLIFLTCIECGFFIHDYTIHYPARSSSAWQSGYAELATYIKNHTSEFDTCIIDYPDNRLYLYFLLAYKTDPRTIIFPDKDYIPASVESIDFKPVTHMPGNRECIVVSKQGWIRLHSPAATVLTDYAKNPLFYIISGNTQ